MEAGIIACEYVTDDRVYIIQNHFAGTKRLSEVLESMIELSLNQKAANQNDSPKREKSSSSLVALLKMNCSI